MSGSEKEIRNYFGHVERMGFKVCMRRMWKLYGGGRTQSRRRDDANGITAGEGRSVEREGGNNVR